MGMNALKAQFGQRGFEVLGFPCNQFDMLEPADNGVEIMNGVKYVRPGNGFLPNFQMFALTEVNGKTEHPLFTYLKKYCPPTSDTFEDGLFYAPLKDSDVRWNFEQFLVDKNGKIAKRYSSDTDPKLLQADISKML